MQSAIRIAQRGAAAESPLAVRARRLSEQSLSPMFLRRDSGSMTAAIDAPSPKLSANRRGAIFPGSAAHEAVKVMVNGSPIPQRLSARRSAISKTSSAECGRCSLYSACNLGAISGIARACVHTALTNW